MLDCKPANHARAALVCCVQEVMLEVEADCYWCLCKLVEQIQDHYTYAQPGIQRAVFKIRELVQ
jgi:TBC1 domain family member 2